MQQFKCTRFSLLIGMLLITIPFNLLSQELSVNKSYMHHEIMDDPYLPNAYENQLTSPAYKQITDLVLTYQVNVNEEGENILGDAANEPSIAVDPTNPSRIMIGWRQFDNVSSNFRQAGYAYTLDGGENWTFPGVIEPGIFRSDPVLDFDASGNFYYNSLTSDQGYNFWCNVYRITDGGVEWDEGYYAYGGDKQWMRIDKNPLLETANNYSFWTSYWSICYPGHFTRSVDGGENYENCVEVNGDPYWGTLAVGPEGELYIVGAGGYTGGIVVAKASEAYDPEEPVAWDFYTQVDLNGELSGFTSINPEGLMGQAWIDVDVSEGPSSGYVYVLAAVDPYGSGDPGEIMFARSTNGGISFEDPVKINDDVSMNNHQWFGTMSVSPNGRIDVIWLDTRDNPGTYLSSLYYSYSTDQGETWSANNRISEAFDPHVGWPNQNKMGDYFDMVSDDNGAHLAWANTLNGEQDVYYTHITPGVAAVKESWMDHQHSFEVYPNPVYSMATIRCFVNGLDQTEFILFDEVGKTVRQWPLEISSEGYHNEQLNLDDLRSGVYYIQLKSGKKTETQKIIVSR